MHSRHLDFFNTKKQQAGFTLIELMIAMIISLTLIFACTTLYSSLKSSVTVAQDLAKAQESLRGSFYLLSRSLRQAQDYSINGTSGAASTELTTVYGVTPIGEDIYSCLGNSRAEGDEDIFSSDGDGLYCDDDGAGTGNVPQLIALDVEELRFENITGNNDDGIKVIMKLADVPDEFSFVLALRQKIVLDLAE